MVWKENLAERLRHGSHGTSEEQAKWLEILYHPKTAGVCEELDEGLRKLLPSECTYTFSCLRENLRFSGGTATS